MGHGVDPRQLPTHIKVQDVSNSVPKMPMHLKFKKCFYFLVQVLDVYAIGCM